MSQNQSQVSEIASEVEKQIRVRKPRLSAKHEKPILFGFWFLQNALSAGFINQESYDKMLGQLHVFEGIDEKVALVDEFTGQSRDVKKSLRQLVKPVRVRKTKGKVVLDVQDELVDMLVAAANGRETKVGNQGSPSASLKTPPLQPKEKKEKKEKQPKPEKQPKEKKEKKEKVVKQKKNTKTDVQAVVEEAVQEVVPVVVIEAVPEVVVEVVQEAVPEVVVEVVQEAVPDEAVPEVVSEYIILEKTPVEPVAQKETKKDTKKEKAVKEKVVKEKVVKETKKEKVVKKVVKDTKKVVAEKVVEKAVLSLQFPEPTSPDCPPPGYVNNSGDKDSGDEDSGDEDELDVSEFNYKGKDYLIDAEMNVYDSVSHEVVGKLVDGVLQT